MTRVLFLVEDLPNPWFTGVTTTLERVCGCPWSSQSPSGSTVGFYTSLVQPPPPPNLCPFPLPLSINRQVFGDPVDWVRDAAHDASKVIMAKLTATGVKLMMPSLLKGLQEPQWRSKQASILLLGSMAYCAPAQLSSCLPQIVPKLCECFTDTHPKIQAASKEALQVSAIPMAEWGNAAKQGVWESRSCVAIVGVWF